MTFIISKPLIIGAVGTFSLFTLPGAALAQSFDTGVGPNIYIDLNGGASFLAGTVTLADGDDLDDPDEISGAPEFDGDIGTALGLGVGVELTSGLELGVEASLVGLNVEDAEASVGGTDYELDAQANALGALFTVGYDVDLGADFSVGALGGVGYYSNTVDGTLSVGGIDTDFGEYTRHGLGYAVGAGLSYNPSPSNRFTLEYRFQNAGGASSDDRATGFDANTVIDFGEAASHQVSLGATFKF